MAVLYHELRRGYQIYPVRDDIPDSVVASEIMNKKPALLSNIKGDLFGGITAGVVALPLALAFGEQTELEAVAGLYGAIALGVVAAILGGTRTQISGPTAPITVVSAVIITEAIRETGSLEAAMPIIVATFVLAGIMQAILGLLKLGKYIKFISFPVVSGFKQMGNLTVNTVSSWADIESQIMILARPEGGIGVSRTHSTSSTFPTDNAVQNLYLEVYR